MGVIATIDGMCGTFKSRTACDIARHFKWSSINCGMIYRAITLFGQDTYGSSLLNYSNMIIDSIRYISINNSYIEINEKKYDFSNLKNYDLDILTSTLANEIVIQNYIHDFLRKYTSSATFVVEGREMFVVFPDAKYHFFFYANPEARAMEIINKNDLSVGKDEFEVLCERVRKRDEKDMCRENNPLRIPQDAIMVDVGSFEFEYSVLLNHVIELIETSYETRTNSYMQYEG